MFRRRATVATIALVGTLVACSAPAPENDATSAAALTVVNPNDECYQNVTSTFWLNAAQASTTIDTRLVWYATSLTMPAGSGPVTSEPYVAFAGLVPQTAFDEPGRGRRPGVGTAGRCHQLQRLQPDLRPGRGERRWNADAQRVPREQPAGGVGMYRERPGRWQYER